MKQCIRQKKIIHKDNYLFIRNTVILLNEETEVHSGTYKPLLTIFRGPQNLYRYIRISLHQRGNTTGSRKWAKCT